MKTYTFEQIHNAVMKQWKKDHLDPNTISKMNAYAISGFLQEALGISLSEVFEIKNATSELDNRA